MGFRFDPGQIPPDGGGICCATMGNGGRTAGDAVPCTPAQGSETLENPPLAAHFMRREGRDDGLSFRPGANPAGRRRDLLEKEKRFGGFRAARWARFSTHRRELRHTVSVTCPSLVSCATLHHQTPVPRRKRPTVAELKLRVAVNPPSPTPARRRERPSVAEPKLRVAVNPPSPTPARRRGRPSVAHDSCPLPIQRPKTANPAAVRRDLPRIEM